jgi:hypothetical protein
MHMTLGTRWLVPASSIIFALLALALTGGRLDGDLSGLAWYYGLMFPWASLGTYLVMIVLFVVPTAELGIATLEVVVIVLAGAIQGAIVATVAVVGRSWCLRRRSLRAV